MYIKAVKIEFDAAKDEINRKRHGISLEAAIGFEWDTALEREDDRFDYGEARFVAIGLIENRLYVLVFTEDVDEDTVRVISLRVTEKHETRYYYDQV